MQDPKESMKQGNFNQFQMKAEERLKKTFNDLVTHIEKQLIPMRKEFSLIRILCTFKYDASQF